ncbi:ParB/RepB/Spo0J family partition protein [Streptomyces sp. NPDC002446]
MNTEPLHARAATEVSLHYPGPAEHPEPAAVTMVPIALLLPADSPRLSGESMEHTRALAASDKHFPPIVVHRSTMRVIDGMHRLRVAELRGQSEIEVRFFDGAEDDAFVLAVESNIGHGLPLTLAERTAAAARIIVSHAQWSDRAIASVTGLSATTVGALRRREGVGGTAGPAARIGRDGKVRPLSTEEGRRMAGRLIVASPDAPLREIAEKAGISPGTVRDVRERLLRGEDPVPASRRTAAKCRARAQTHAQVRPEQSVEGRAEGRGGGRIIERERRRRPAEDSPTAPEDGLGQEVPQAELDALFRNLCKDPSMRHTEMGRLLLRMLEMQLVGAQRWGRIAEAIPAHRADMVLAAATECARAWEEFATQVALRRIA